MSQPPRDNEAEQQLREDNQEAVQQPPAGETEVIRSPVSEAETKRLDDSSAPGARGAETRRLDDSSSLIKGSVPTPSEIFGTRATTTPTESAMSDERDTDDAAQSRSTRPLVEPELPGDSFDSYERETAVIVAEPMQPSDAEVARSLAQAVREVDGVADLYNARSNDSRLSSGSSQALGVFMARTDANDVAVEVHFIAIYEPQVSFPQIANAVRDRVWQELSSMSVGSIDRVDVVVADIAVPALEM